MGGRGSGSGIERGIAGGGGESVKVVSDFSLISMREDGKQQEVDAVLDTIHFVHDKYGTDLNDLQIVKLGAGSQGVMAFYDSMGNLAVNTNYFDHAAMNAAYDRATADGFHPGRGLHTAMEAVVAHELGHHLTDLAGQRAGLGAWQIDRVANEIVDKVTRKLGYHNTAQVAKAISGYAQHNTAETIAEAYSDVYCNGKNAARESREVVKELERRLRRK